MHPVCLNIESYYYQQFLVLDVKTLLTILVLEHETCVLQGLALGIVLWRLSDVLYRCILNRE
jgi:hypothetical protein